MKAGSAQGLVLKIWQRSGASFQSEGRPQNLVLAENRWRGRFQSVFSYTNAIDSTSLGRKGPCHVGDNLRFTSRSGQLDCGLAEFLAIWRPARSRRSRSAACTLPQNCPGGEKGLSNSSFDRDQSHACSNCTLSASWM